MSNRSSSSVSARLVAVIGLLGVCGLVAWPSPASARRPDPLRALRAIPVVYDPDALGLADAMWDHGEGIWGDWALVLVKNAPTAADLAAGARICGVEGVVLDALGFDLRDDSHCGAGAPRWNVITQSGHLYFFGCAHGQHYTVRNGLMRWTRVRFDDRAAQPGPGAPPWPGFGKVRLARLSLVFDEGTDQGSGYAVLDNLMVNNRPAGPLGRGLGGRCPSEKK